jgi:hypothetical protein
MLSDLAFMIVGFQSQQCLIFLQRVFFSSVNGLGGSTSTEHMVLLGFHITTGFLHSQRMFFGWAQERDSFAHS